VLGGGRTFVVREGVKRLLPEVIDTDALRAFVDRLLAGTGRRLDLASPIVSAQLEDGSRVHITGPPVTHPARMNVQIRRFVLAAGMNPRRLGSCGVTADELRSACMPTNRHRARADGKTTLINCLLSEVPPDRRVVTCEEVFEIADDLPDMTQMQTRDAGLDGGGEITLRDLVRSSLRQRPDRIVVGEVRGAEALDLLLALNAGCSGLATCAPTRLDALTRSSGAACWPVRACSSIAQTSLASVADLVVFLKRAPPPDSSEVGL
jgi:pilus assembly protein CpaF